MLSSLLRHRKECISVTRHASQCFPYSLYSIRNASSKSDYDGERGLDSVQTEDHTLKAVESPGIEGTPWTIDDVNPIVSASISLIDGFHSSLGLPWWATIGMIGVGARTIVLPVTIRGMKASAAVLPLWRQAQKESRLALNAAGLSKEETEKASSSSGTNVMDVALRFHGLRSKYKLPNPIWVLAAPFVQLPVFITAMASVRTMSSNNWPGFSTGGIAWFPDLTFPAVDIFNWTAPYGPYGVILPLGIVFNMLAIIDMSFSSRTLKKEQKKDKDTNESTTSSDLNHNTENAVILWAMDKLRLFLEWMLVPLFVVSLQLPHAALCYWAGSSIFASIQNILFRNTYVRNLLGIQPRILERHSMKDIQYVDQAIPIKRQSDGPSDVPLATMKEDPMPFRGFESNETVQQLFVHAAELQAKGKSSDAVNVLERILIHQPNHPRALFALGQVYAKMKEWILASEAYMKAASQEKNGHQKNRACFGAGVAFFQIGLLEDSLMAFQNVIASENAPDSLKIRSWISSAVILEKQGRMEDAIEALTKAAAKEPKVNALYLEPLLKRIGKA